MNGIIYILLLSVWVEISPMMAMEGDPSDGTVINYIEPRRKPSRLTRGCIAR